MDNKKIAEELIRISRDVIALQGSRPWRNNEDNIAMVNKGQFNRYFNEWFAHADKTLWGWANKFSNPKDHTGGLTYKKGGKFIKVIEKNSRGQDSSAFCFVDLSNGDLLKSASWSAPAKHARGNIFDKSSWKNTTPFGMEYL